MGFDAGGDLLLTEGLGDVIDPPELPQGTNPGRKTILAIGVFLALIAGFSSVTGLQILSQTVIGRHHLESLIGVAPLVTVPRLATLDEKIKMRRLIMRLAMMAPLAMLMFLILLSL